MRLKHTYQPLGLPRPRRRNRRGNLRRMMPVIIEHFDVIYRSLVLESPVGIPESFKCFGDLLEIDVKLKRNRYSGERIVNIVFAWHRKVNNAQFLIFVKDRETRAEIVDYLQGMTIKLVHLESINVDSQIGRR